jgi:hypothetical protein
MREIRVYPNTRKFYLRSHGYVNSTEILELIKDGHQVRFTLRNNQLDTTEDVTNEYGRKLLITIFRNQVALMDDYDVWQTLKSLNV